MGAQQTAGLHAVDAEGLPSCAFTAMAILNEAGYEAFLVGGIVRDAILGTPAHDVDIATSASCEQSSAAFRAAGCAVIETGIKHGTITAFVEGRAVEVTTYRVDGAYSDGRHPDSVRFVTTIEDDLSRRDLTINAMAWNPARGIVDPFGGRDDLARGIVRAVGDPRTRMEEDALRVLRALRFASRLGFALEPATAHAVLALTPQLERVSAERIAHEYDGIVAGAHAPQILREFAPVMVQVVPEIGPMIGFDQKSRWHCFDVWEHCLHALEYLNPKASNLVRHATLLHDVGKPVSFTTDEQGHRHFAGHEEAGARLARVIFRRLRWRSIEIDRVCTLIRLHDHRIDPSERGVRRMLSRLSVTYVTAEAHAPTLLHDLIELKRADVAAHTPGCVKKREAELDEVEAAFARVMASKQVFRLGDLNVSGQDLMALGIPQGPEVGRTLRWLLSLVVDEKAPNERDALLARALEYRGASSEG